MSKRNNNPRNRATYGKFCGIEKTSKREVERFEEQVKEDKLKEQTKEIKENILLWLISIVLAFLITKMFF
jgi:hypothetical protein